MAEKEGATKLFKMDPSQKVICKELCQGEVESLGGGRSSGFQYYGQRSEARFCRGLRAIPIFSGKREMDSKRKTSRKTVSFCQRLALERPYRKAGASGPSSF